MTADRFIDIIFNYTIFAFSILLFVIALDAITNVVNLEIKKEIIKNSEEYIIFNDCTEIDNKYYCK